jgi:hypothetical protein
MFEIAEMAYKGVRWVPVSQVVMRLMVQVCRQPGLSSVYSEIMSFSGNEIYFIDCPEAAGREYGEVAFSLCDGIAMGLSRQGRAMVNPPPRTLLEGGDRLLVLTDNCSSCRIDERPEDGAPAEAAVREGRGSPEPERILILSGESRRVSFMLGLLDSYVAGGSSITVAGSIPERQAREFLPPPGDMMNCTLGYARVDMTSYDEMKAIRPLEYDSILVLAGRVAEKDDEEADSRCMVALLILRRLREETGCDDGPIIISEIRNPRNRKLASAARIDDFVVSNEVTSMIMAQLIVQPDLWDVYYELFDPRGCEIQMRPFGIYCPAGGSIAFGDLMRAGRRRGETVLGYLVREQDTDDRVELNPEREILISPGSDDMVIILAER